MLVDAVLQFRFDLIQAIHHGLPLLFREVQRLAGFVRKKGIIPDLLTERRSADQVGVEQDTVGIRPGILRHLGLHDLSGRETNDRPVLIIVTLTAVHDVAATGILQEKGIHPIIDPEMLGPPRRFRQIDHAYQRMPRLESEKFVVLVYFVEFYNLFHRSERFSFEQK